MHDAQPQHHSRRCPEGVKCKRDPGAALERGGVTGPDIHSFIHSSSGSLTPAWDVFLSETEIRWGVSVTHEASGWTCPSLALAQGGSGAQKTTATRHRGAGARPCLRADTEGLRVGHGTLATSGGIALAGLGGRPTLQPQTQGTETAKRVTPQKGADPTGGGGGGWHKASVSGGGGAVQCANASTKSSGCDTCSGVIRSYRQH